MGCFGECWDAGPPPDSILFIPPPPVPVILQQSLPDLLLNSTPCSSSHPCEAWVNHMQGNTAGVGAGSGDYVDLPRKDANWSVSSIDDTWLLVLVASAIGVLLLGALLALFLLKCREMNIFGSNECSIVHTGHHRPMKSHEPRDCTSINGVHTNKLTHHPPEAVMYTGPSSMQDNRMVWAALTPRGTQHFISENYPRNLIDYAENEDHYETIDNLNIPHVNAVMYNIQQKGLPLKLSRPNVGMHNSGFVDYDYEDPTPLIESYQLSDIENREGNPYYSTLGNTDMRCASMGSTLRRGSALHLPIRPRVSSPTRIEHPNLPPLNLYPHKGGSTNSTLTLKKHTSSYRKPENIVYSDNLLPKYGC